VLERINAALAAEIERDGRVFVSSARVRGRFALRLCILNYSTNETHVDRALELAATLPVDTSPAPAVVVETSYAPLTAGWLRRANLDAEVLRGLPLFATLDEDLLELVLRDSHEHHAVGGEAIVEQWQVSRDLYVVLRGRVAVTVEDDAVRTLGPGEFFGEVAALDWGAGFGRTRTATVAADEPTRLLVLGWQLVHRLAKAAPEFGAALERASKSRLAQA
jgi:hypothetical protein